MARITVEDSLKKVPSRFALVVITSERAKRLLRGAKPFVQADNRAIVTALREVAGGKITYKETKVSTKRRHELNSAD
ncbi:MAG: DNA-directed RNA polymerase subunit omega [Deltaproteobacteria bacterium]|nr:DNA-directed RNA polymerase subunit omega [Deltaproteobacteria bacterium]